ncbi:MAG: hypothetical protein OXC72_00845 [Roseovarius sp.]|nr:hypothetical protein [Roseovarius sp.]
MMRMRGVDVHPGNGIETEIVKLVQCLRAQWRTRTSSCGPLFGVVPGNPRLKGHADAKKSMRKLKRLTANAGEASRRHCSLRYRDP